MIRLLNNYRSRYYGSSLLAFAFILFMATSCNSQKQAATTTTTAKKARTERPGGKPPSVDEAFKMDANKDGKLAKSEVKGRLAEDFARFDTNSDGFITRKEFENAPRPQRGGGGRPQN